MTRKKVNRTEKGFIFLLTASNGCTISNIKGKKSFKAGREGDIAKF